MELLTAGEWRSGPPGSIASNTGSGGQIDRKRQIDIREERHRNWYSVVEMSDSVRYRSGESPTIRWSNG